MNRRKFLQGIAAAITVTAAVPLLKYIPKFEEQRPLEDVSDRLKELIKALENHHHNTNPSSLMQGSALQVEDLSVVMNNVTFEDRHIKLWSAL